MKGINKKYPQGFSHTEQKGATEGERVSEPLLFSVEYDEEGRLHYRLQAAQIVIGGKEAAVWVSADANVEQVARQLIEIALDLRGHGIERLSELVTGASRPRVGEFK